MYQVKEKDLIGEIEGFPIEVVQKMIERQVEQGNPADVSLFQKENFYIGKSYGGFSFPETPEKFQFWNQVFNHKNFDLFFERYPKQEQAVETAPVEPQFPCWMYVADTREGLKKKNKRFVICKLNKYYLAINSANNGNEENLYEAASIRGFTPWSLAIPIPPKTKLTRAEIAEKLGIDHDFEIID